MTGAALLFEGGTRRIDQKNRASRPVLVIVAVVIANGWAHKKAADLPTGGF